MKFSQLFEVVVCTVALVVFSPRAWSQAELFRFNWSSPAVANSVSTASVRLDGYRLFSLAAPKTFPLEQRVTGIERLLQRLVDANPEVFTVINQLDPRTGQPIIKVNDQYLMTVTSLDAQGYEPQTWADQITQILRDSLARAKEERRLSFLINRGIILSCSLVLLLILSRLIGHWLHRLRQKHDRLQSELNVELSQEQTESLKLAKQQQINLTYFQRRGLQAILIGLWAGLGFTSLGLFVHTRWLQVYLTGVPLSVVLIGLGTYLIIRLSDVLIDRGLGLIKANDLSQLSQRLILRLATMSRVLKNISLLFWLSFGGLGILSVLGVDLLPLLTGAGIVGLAISFGAQGLIKDIINGFLIILEDQYGVGDVIAVGSVGGLVENMNLRITQVRNNEGQLITIPNGAISIVQNLSKDWARVDLTIEFDYDTDVDKALNLLNQMATAMFYDRLWGTKILEMPEVLGIDSLQHTGVLVRVWIKTQPLQQWAVAREFRRRLKILMADENLAIGSPRQALITRGFPADG